LKLGHSEVNGVLAAKSEGYITVLYYVALESMLDNVIRVDECRTGLGHHVEQEDILRRHKKSKINLLNYIGMFDKANIFDNLRSVRSRVAMDLFK
jgi:predicted ABC-type ATPase